MSLESGLLRKVEIFLSTLPQALRSFPLIRIIRDFSTTLTLPVSSSISQTPSKIIMNTFDARRLTPDGTPEPEDQYIDPNGEYIYNDIDNEEYDDEDNEQDTNQETEICDDDDDQAELMENQDNIPDQYDTYVSLTAAELVCPTW
jgi:hypothetical protein